MGFRTGAYAKVWDVMPMSDTCTKLRISISRKNKQTGEYEQDFTGFVLCIGTAAAQKATHLSEGARIKLGDCDVSTKYDAEKKMNYTNFKVFSFDNLEETGMDAGQPIPLPLDEGMPDDNQLPY